MREGQPVVIVESMEQSRIDAIVEVAGLEAQ
jgi:hypothetical protein